MAKPVQVQTCEACGTPGCASGGYVHVSALNDLVLWTLPQVGEIGERDNFAGTATARFGSVAFPAAAWDLLRSAAHEVPDVNRLPRSDGNALRDAWAAGQGRPKAPYDLLPWLRSRLLAAETLEVAVAIQSIECWLDWFQQQAGIAVGAVVQRADEVGATIEKFYFDGPAEDDWAALARYRDSYVPALGPNHILIPEAATP
jgi:hypothetical protein